MITDGIAEFTPLRTWINGKEIDDGVLEFTHDIENDLEELSKLLGVDLVIMAIKSRNE